jgi:predicted AAA+ superfamily ATPase
MLYERKLRLDLLLAEKSHFLFGPRSTGKTTLIAQQLKGAKVYDLLDDDIYVRLLRSPKLIEEENRNQENIIVIDEIQKLPKLLDEVHRLIHKYNWKFLLTGSSARKLKRGAANMLGGRAWQAHLFPLTWNEIPNFDLQQYLNRGGLPFVQSSTNFHLDLKNYVSVYLREEIMAEAIVKNHDYFMSFLDVIALSNGQEINYESISRDSGVPARTILNYVQVLEDTLLCHQLKPYRKTKSRKAVSKSKLYLFDLGVTNVLAKRGTILPGSELFGYAFEHFIVNEIRAYLSYNRLDSELCFWRTTEQLEVVCILGDQVAIEIKGTNFVRPDHCKGLNELKKERIFQAHLVVSLDPTSRTLDNGIVILPWADFLRRLWQNEWLDLISG